MNEMKNLTFKSDGANLVELCLLFLLLKEQGALFLIRLLIS